MLEETVNKNTRNKPSTSCATPPRPTSTATDLDNGDIGAAEAISNAELFTWDSLILTNSQLQELESWDIEEQIKVPEISSASSSHSTTTTVTRNVHQQIRQVGLQPQPMAFHGCNVTINYDCSMQKKSWFWDYLLFCWIWSINFKSCWMLHGNWNCIIVFWSCWTLHGVKTLNLLKFWSLNIMERYLPVTR